MKPVFITGQVFAIAGLLFTSTAFAQTAEEEREVPAPEERAEQEAAEEEAERAPGEVTESERIRVQTDPETDVVVVDREQTVREGEGERARLPFGASVMVGGGVGGFATDDMTDVTDVGGTWEARLAAGTNTPIGFEVGYIGSAQDIDALGLDEDAILLGNGAEAIGRVNLINESPVQPYAFGGGAYRNYRITNSDQNTSSLANSDDIFEVPVGAGVSFDLGEGLLLDARGTYRVAFDDDLTAADAPEDQEVGSDLNSWGATLRLGYEF